MISVLMAAYNAEAFLSRAIESVQAQTVADWEIIVSDDASSDDTCALVEALAVHDNRIRLIRASANGGPSRARNSALEQARGEWVAILDADDAWRPTRLARLLDVAGQTQCDVVADNLIFFDDHIGAEIGAALSPSSSSRPIDASDVLLSERPWPSFRLGFLKPMVRLAFLRQTGLRYRESYRYAEDFMLLSELLLSGAKAILLEEPLYIYTVQLNSLSGRKSSTSRSTYDPEQRLRIAEELESKYSDASSSRDRNSLRRYQCWMRDVRNGYIAINGVRARKAGSLRTLVRTSPRAVGVYLLTTPTWKRLMQKSIDLVEAPAGPQRLRRRIM